MSNPAIVLDNGSAVSKAGLASEMEPAALFPTVVSRVKHTSNDVSYDVLVAPDLQNRIKKNTALNYPIENGIVSNWEDMEKIWNYTFKDLLKVNPEEHPMLLTEVPYNPNSNREKMAEIMYEKFSTPSILIMIQGALSMYGTGQINGMILEIGHGVTQLLPIIEGYTITNSISKADMAGSDLTEYLMKKLSTSNEHFTTRADKEMICEVKEKFCYVCEDYDKELKLETNKANYTLPDGRCIQIGNEKFHCPELLFNPTLIGMNINGVHNQLNDCIQSCAMDVRKTLYSNIVLAGGTAMLPGFGKRLEKEMATLAQSGMKIKVKEVKHKHLAWVGGAVLANHSSFHSLSITKQLYEEHGAAVIHRTDIR